MNKFNNFKTAAFALFAALNFGPVQIISAKESNSIVAAVNDLTPNQFLQLTSMCSNDPATARRWRVRNHTTNPIAYTYSVYGTSVAGGGLALPGDNFFETPTQFNSSTGLPTPNTTKIFWSVDGSNFQTVKASGGALCENVPVTCYAEEVISYEYTKRNDGTSLLSTRTIGTNALGAPQNSDVQTSEANLNFAALGFGGNIVLKFGSPIKNGAGNDFKVFETTFGGPECARYPERVKAFASQDGCHYVYLGEQCQDAEFDLGTLAWAQYIKLVDASPIDASYNNAIADGYDVDGIMCLNGFEPNPVPSTLLQGAASEAFDYFPGTRKNGSAIASSRTNENNAEGFPQNTNTINFVALGFGGTVTLRFDYVIFDNPLASDLLVTETSFGNPSCSSYGERAMFEGSLDGENWIYLNEFCLDGQLDINAAGVIQYLRITDRSPISSFGGTADGYDVDGVTVINDCSAPSGSKISDNTLVADEVFGAEVFPNPFTNDLNIQLVTGDQDSKITISVSNYLGQNVQMETVNVAKSSNTIHHLNLSNLNKGIYFLTIESNSSKETIKVVKN